MRTDLTSCKSVARLAQTILQALNPSYAEHSPVTSIDRGVFVSATWGRCGNLAQAQGMGKKAMDLLYVYGIHPGESQVAISPLCRPSLSANCRCSDDPWVHDSGET